MLLKFTIVIIVLLPASLFAQDIGREAQADLVKTAVERIAASGDRRVRIVLRDLRPMAGKIARVRSHSVDLEPVRQKKALITIGPKRRKDSPARNILFRDVLQLEGDGLAMSFIPHPKKPNHGSWDELREIGVGEFLQVELLDGSRRHGVFASVDDTHITVVRGDKYIRLDRNEVVRLFRVAGATKSLASKLAKGAKAGAKVSDELFPIYDPQAIANPAALGLGAGIGALLYLIPRGSATRVLVYSQ